MSGRHRTVLDLVRFEVFGFASRARGVTGTLASPRQSKAKTVRPARSYLHLAVAALSAAAQAQGVVGPPTRVPAARPNLHRACRTPAAWIPELVSVQLDQNGNLAEDVLDALPPRDPVDVILALNACPDASDLARFTAGGGTLTYVSPNLSVAHLAGIPAGAAVALGADVRVAMVFLDRPLAPFLDTSVAAIRVTTSGEYAGANLADVGAGLDGSGVTVAVIDTGIDSEHVGLPPQKFVGGIDFTLAPPDPVLADPDDTDGHGTFVAGIIAGEGGGGSRGVAPGARLVDVKVADSGGAATSVVLRAIDECIARRDAWGIGVIHVGFGGDVDSAGDDPLSQAAVRAVQAGIVVVAPMGNEGLQRVPAPAAADMVLAVAALDDMGTVTRADEAVAALSNVGPRLDDGDADTSDEEKPDCAAPGIAIASTEHDSAGGYVLGSGTSAASAHVAGLAALVRGARPSWPPQRVRSRILRTCEPLGGPGWGPATGHGEIDAFRALVVEVENLGLASVANAEVNHVGGDFVALQVDEATQQTDFNGDGDDGDQVLVTFDVASGALVNPAVSCVGFLGSGRRILLLVNESDEGATDLNGDGDLTDTLVLHLYDGATGALTNLALEAVGPLVTIQGDLAAFTVSEAGNGDTDFNGDGDTLDNVAFVHDAPSSTTTNLGLAGVFFASSPVLASLYVDEAAHAGTDLNGDGDAADQVVHVYDAAAATTTNLALASSGELNQTALSGSVTAFRVPESAQGATDLDGDGDANDLVIFAYDVVSDTLSSTGLATAGDLLVAEGRIAFEASEAAQGGTDLNGDGDAVDAVVHVHELQSATTTNLGLATIGDIGYIATPQFEGDTLAFGVNERRQGGTDLNGDGDALDRVVHVHDAASGTTVNLQLASIGYASGPLAVHGRVTTLVHEIPIGTDLNGDGDALDPVLHVHDPSTGTTTNTALATTKPSVHFVLVSETLQGATDLNGDGDTLDLVVHALVLESGMAVNLGLASTSLLDGPVACVLVSEAAQGNTDLNGDGDATDLVFFVASKP